MTERNILFIGQSLNKRNQQRLEKYLRKHPQVGTSPSGIAALQIAHDDWCSLLQHKGLCDCNPAFSYHPITQDDISKITGHSEN